MAEVTITSDLEKQKWLATYFEEYIRESGFLPYMGRSSSKVIVTKYELQEEAGKTINIPLITRLTNDGVSGSQMLDGAEEDMGIYNCPLSIDWRRNGVRIPKSTSYKTEIDLWGAAKDLLRAWEAEKLRDDIIECMMRVERAVNYGASSTTTRNNWLAANADRVLYGVTISNASSLVHATALLNVDTAADKLTTSVGSLARRIARSANPHIRPFKTETGREFYVMFVGARAFRDLKLDTVLQNANRDARSREGRGGEAYMDNPLFVDGDQWFDGVLYHEVPEIDDIAAQTSYFNGAGAASADVRPCFLCGAQSIAVAWGQTPEMRTDTRKDYEFRPGVAIEELLEVDKTFFGTNPLTTSSLKQHGMVTVFVAAAADS